MPKYQVEVEINGMSYITVDAATPEAASAEVKSRIGDFVLDDVLDRPDNSITILGVVLEEE